jgi:protein-tyrosine phosphatase
MGTAPIMLNSNRPVERRLAMRGTPNFRDFGGYPSACGRRVKWGYLFRSGQLSTLSETDVALLGSLGLDLVFDFRREEEQQREPSRFPLHKPPKVRSMPITPGNNAGFFERSDTDQQAMFEFMVDINRDFAEDQSATYSRMFAEILAVEDARLLVHCAAGKDRTGFAAAIILLALGVSRKAVMADYMLTAQYFNPEQEMARIRAKYQMDLQAEAILPMLEVHEDYLAAALTSIDKRYASVEAYLTEQLGVGKLERLELRSRYLS